MSLYSAFAIVMLAALAAAETEPPAPHEDVGICPFECCTYRQWEARAEIVLLSEPRADATIIGRLPKFSKVVALTGKIVTEQPGEFVVTVPRGTYKLNDHIYLYSYLGEGFYRTWLAGKWTDLDLGCCADRSIPGCLTVDDKNCWGRISKRPVSTWWAKIETSDRQLGWTKDTDKFNNQDSCG